MKGLAIGAVVGAVLAGCSGAADDATDRATSGGGFGGSGAGGMAGIGGSAGIGGMSGVGGAGGQPFGMPCDVNGEPGYCIDAADCFGDYSPHPGYCPGPKNIQCCTMTKAGKCDPMAKVIPKSVLVESPGVGGCLPGMVPITTYCIDRYEAALVKVADGMAWSPYFNPGMVPVRAVSVKDAVPQGYIDGLQAESACIAAGKRLCTDTEWLRACRGPNKYTYPYGNGKMLGVCNDHRDVHPAVEYYGTTDSWIYSKIDNACLNQLPKSLAKAGANLGCVSAEGAYDLMGNLHEWTADPAGTFRGGFYVDTVLNGPGCLYATTAHNTLHWDYSTGFRCCADL